MTLWSARFDKKMAASFEAMNSSLAVDIRLLPYEVKQNIAYARRLAAIGIIEKDELKKIEQGLKRIVVEFERGDYFPLPAYEDVHSLVEYRLTELIGDIGKKIHTGRSRNEEIATDIRLYLAAEAMEIKRLIKKLVSSIVRKAREHGDAVLPGFTHMQHAQPLLFAHYLCSFAHSLVEDGRRLDKVAESALSYCPMGSGAIAGSAFPIDREKIAIELGFKKPSPNSISAISQRDELLEMMSALAIIMIHLSRYAEDLIIYSTPEYGFLELDESVSTGSSMMPQKKNPDSLELIRGKAARVIGNMQALYVLMKGVPLTYSRDMQEDKRPVFDSVDETKLSLAVFAEVVSTLKVNEGRMKESLEWTIFATDIADYLTKKGLPFRQSYSVVGALIKEALMSGREFGKFSLAQLKKISPHFEKDVFELLSAKASVGRRDLVGGTSPRAVKEQIKELSGAL